MDGIANCIIVCLSLSPIYSMYFVSIQNKTLVTILNLNPGF